MMTTPNFRCSSTPDGPVRAFLLGQLTIAAAPDGHSASRSASVPPDIDEVGITTRHNTFFSDGRQFQLRRLVFKRGAIELVSTDQQPLPPAAAWTRKKNSDDSLFRRRRSCLGYGRRLPGCRRSEFSAAAWPTTTGRWAFPDRCGPSSHTTADPNLVLQAVPSSAKTATSEVWEPWVSAERARRGELPIHDPAAAPAASTPAWRRADRVGAGKTHTVLRDRPGRCAGHR